ncbi:MAG TPA: hypothetical protein VKV73_24110 [Chloroflexota bacterium]|nr:hypothetical protein [Chloroflexota bacterium]
MPVEQQPVSHASTREAGGGVQEASALEAVDDQVLVVTTPRRADWSRAAMLGITIGSALAALCVWVFGGQGIFHDAYNYYLLGKLIGANGLFGYSVAPEAATGFFPILLKAKPNGYPLVVAVSGVFSTFDLQSIRGVLFFVQLAALIGACWFAAKRLAGIFRSTGVGLAIYAVTVLNPLLLFFVVELMSDLLSAVLVYVAVVLALKQPFLHSTVNVRRDFIASFVIASFATTVRSGNFVILGALVLIWALRWLWYRDFSVRVVPMAMICATIPFVPQLVANYLAFGVISPFLAESGYAGDLDFGARILKYVTAVIPDAPVQWVYTNPLLPPGVMTAADFIQASALGYVGTLGLHLFTLLDQDVAFVFVTDFNPWYRWPVAIFGYAFIAAACVGFVVALGRELKARTNDARSFALVATLVAGLACLVLYVPPHVENRYSLPVYPLWSAAAVFGLIWAWSPFRNRRWRMAGLVAVGGVVFIGACVGLSAWLETLRHPLY